MSDRFTELPEFDPDLHQNEKVKDFGKKFKQMYGVSPYEKNLGLEGLISKTHDAKIRYYHPIFVQLLMRRLIRVEKGMQVGHDMLMADVVKTLKYQVLNPLKEIENAKSRDSK